KTQTTGAQSPATEHMRGKSEQILLHPVGCEARKIPADAEVFFLDFPSPETSSRLCECDLEA
ncbi:MAG: hypothetical protein WA867_16485, partial [Candidatus Acidiferrales bacterium]